VLIIIYLAIWTIEGCAIGIAAFFFFRPTTRFSPIVAISIFAVFLCLDLLGSLGASVMDIKGTFENRQLVDFLGTNQLEILFRFEGFEWFDVLFCMTQTAFGYLVGYFSLKRKSQVERS